MRDFEKLARLSAESDVLTHRAMSERDEARRAADVCRQTLAGFQLELDAKKAENERLREQLTASTAQTAVAIRQRDEFAHFSAAARETWEACHRVLGTRPGIIIPHAIADLMKERDEQRARAEKAKIELAQVHESFGRESAFVREQLDGARSELREARRERDKALSDFATIDRMLVERTKERDNALANALVIERGRDAVREQLAAIEWASLRKDDHGGPLSACCPICQGVKPGHEVGSRFAPEQVGHRMDCWFFKRVAASPQFIEYARERATDARPEPRFKVGEKVVADAHGKTWEGVIERPREDGGVWFYDIRCANSVILSGEESQIKPAPKFAVGEWVKYRGEPAEINRRDWDPRLAQWFYALGAFTNVAESFLLPMPQPKFSIGDWVSHGSEAHAHGWPDFEVERRYYSHSMAEWMYLSSAGGSPRESELTAQTPQYGHDGTACAFLGRMCDLFGRTWDIWFSPNSDGQFGFACGYGRQWFKADFRFAADFHGVGMAPLLIEARRRAKLRGLIQ